MFYGLVAGLVPYPKLPKPYHIKRILKNGKNIIYNFRSTNLVLGIPVEGLDDIMSADVDCNQKIVSYSQRTLSK